MKLRILEHNIRTHFDLAKQYSQGNLANKMYHYCQKRSEFKKELTSISCSISDVNVTKVINDAMNDKRYWQKEFDVLREEDN